LVKEESFEILNDDQANLKINWRQAFNV